MGWGKFFKTISKVALPVIGTAIAPGIGTALGSSLGAATLSGIGGAVGGGVGGAIGGGGLKGALTGAALGGAGGYLANGGLSDLLSGTSLGSGINSVSNALGFGDVISPAADTARAVSSAGATGAAGNSTLSGYLPSAGGGGAGGGTSGGFISNLFSSTPSTTVGKATLPWLTDVANGTAAANPFTDYSAISGVSNAMKLPTAGSFARTLIPYALSKNNTGGFNAIRSADANTASMYSPYVSNGAGATSKLSDLYGLNGTDAQTAAFSDIQNTPGYNFVRDQGIKALDASAASRGMLRSGNQEQAVQQYGTNLANTYMQDYIKNLVQQQQFGQNAVANTGNANLDAAQAYAALKNNKASMYNNLIAGLFV